MLAATGVLRGLQDTRTPLYVAVGGNLANIALNVLLVYGLDLGIAGSAIGTDLAQLGAGGGAGRWSWSAPPDASGAPLRPRPARVRAVRPRRRSPSSSAPSRLQACLLVTTCAAARLGATDLATHQLAITVWTFLAFALDAIAIAAQTITGTAPRRRRRRRAPARPPTG